MRNLWLHITSCLQRRLSMEAIMWWTSRKACCICLFLTRSLCNLPLTWLSVVFMCFDLRIWFPFSGPFWLLRPFLNMTSSYHLSPHLTFVFGSYTNNNNAMLLGFSNILVGLSLQALGFTRHHQRGDCGGLYHCSFHSGSSGRREISTEFQHYRVCAVVRAHCRL